MTEGKNHNGSEEEEKPEQGGPPPSSQPIEDEPVEFAPDEDSSGSEVIETSEPAQDEEGRSTPNRDD